MRKKAFKNSKKSKVRQPKINKLKSQSLNPAFYGSKARFPYLTILSSL